MGHDEIAGASLLNGLNSGLQRWPQRSWAQREGMVLLEYEAMSYLIDVAHDGVLCTFSNTDQPQTGASGEV
jgi:hypothetical protein